MLHSRNSFNAFSSKFGESEFDRHTSDSPITVNHQPGPQNDFEWKT